MVAMLYNLKGLYIMSIKITTKKQFDALCKTITDATHKLTDSIQACIVYAFDQARTHDNYDAMQRLLQALYTGRVYSETAAVSKYVAAHGPFAIRREKGEAGTIISVKKDKTPSRMAWADLIVTYYNWSQPMADKALDLITASKRVISLVEHAKADLPPKEYDVFRDKTIEALGDTTEVVEDSLSAAVAA